MRFEPKIVEASNDWDDEPNELQLPGDLAELGKQLHEDALHLARLHPPWSDNDSERVAISQISGRPSKSWRTSASLGALVSVATLAMIAAGVAVYRTATQAPTRANVSTAVKVADDSSESRPSHLFAMTVIDNTAAPAEKNGFAFPPMFVTPPTGPVAPLSPHDASLLQTGGPQAEAYLDYIEMTTVRNVKLSL